MFETDREPDHIGPTGVKWWIDKSSTRWARRNLHDLPSPLATAVAWVVEHPDGRITRVLTEGDEYLVESQVLDEFAAKIDVLIMKRRAEQTE